MRTMDVEGIEDRSFLFTPLADAPEGTCELARGAMWFFRGKTDTYDVNICDRWCSCPHHTNRLVPGEKCKHIRALEDHLTREGYIACPRCDGSGCADCEWRGVLPPDHPALREIVKSEALTDEQLKQLFR